MWDIFKKCAAYVTALCVNRKEGGNSVKSILDTVLFANSDLKLCSWAHKIVCGDKL